MLVKKSMYGQYRDSQEGEPKIPTSRCDILSLVIVVQDIRKRCKQPLPGNIIGSFQIM